MTDDNTPPQDCQQPAYHDMHLCILQYLDAPAAARLAEKPLYRCRRCDLQARLSKNLCQPVAI